MKSIMDTISQIHQYRRQLLLLCTLCFSFPALSLEFNRSESSLHFISIKKNAIAEVNHFKQYSVSLNADGTFKLFIDLKSVDTAIEVRNYRLRNFLFEVARFPNATVIGHLPPSLYINLTPGQYVRRTLNANLSLHGMIKKISANIEIIALADGTLRVSTLQPILLNAKTFGLGNGIKKLAELAKLDAINTVVPVTFSFSFKR